MVYSKVLHNFRFYSAYLMFSQSTDATTVESILQFGGHSEERRPKFYSDTVLSITLQNKSEAAQHSRDLNSVYSAGVSPGIPVHTDKSIRNIERNYSTMTWTITLIYRIFLGSKLSFLFIQK
jgi:hypothetical protein